MKISAIKFVLCFLFCAFVFLFASSSLLDQLPESFLGTNSQTAWQSAISTILSPIKAILIGPLLPFIEFLRQDPDTPPPFFLVGFAIYWTLLALVLYFVINKIRSSYFK